MGALVFLPVSSARAIDGIVKAMVARFLAIVPHKFQRHESQHHDSSHRVMHHGIAPRNDLGHRYSESNRPEEMTPTIIELFKFIVAGVEVTEKKRVTLELTAIPTAHASWFNLTCNVGAGAGLEPATFGL